MWAESSWRLGPVSSPGGNIDGEDKDGVDWTLKVDDKATRTQTVATLQDRVSQERGEVTRARQWPQPKEKHTCCEELGVPRRTAWK